MSAADIVEVEIGEERLEISPQLLGKYNQPGPRYTSYPTAPEWDERFGPAQLREAFSRANANQQPAPLSLYFHIPFCQSLCLFCGCNVSISKNHDVALPYLEAIKKEIEWFSREIASGRLVHQLHWGGGTPTYLSAEQIEDLFGFIAERFSFALDAEMGVEVDPRVTSEAQCGVLRRLGFNRLSMGIQDFNPLVQKTVHRIQPYELTKALFDRCRDLGFESINIDLIYGLPHQTAESFAHTLDKIIEMGPDRVACFSYAHVPWMKKQQGSFAKHLPAGMEKFRIFHTAITKLTEAGYRYIGMDHFARPEDELCRAQDDRTLHRNFQGYTTKAGCDLYAMGVSSISAVEDVYAQNWRDLPRYYEAIAAGRWPVMRGILLSDEDKLRRSVINRLLCHCVVFKSDVEGEFGINFDSHFGSELERLRELERDRLVRLSEERIEVAGLGRVFIRNVAMIFDEYLNKPQSSSHLFSKTL